MINNFRNVDDGLRTNFDFGIAKTARLIIMNFVAESSVLLTLLLAIGQISDCYLNVAELNKY